MREGFTRKGCEDFLRVRMLEFGLHSSRSHQMDIWTFNIWVFHCILFLGYRKEKGKKFKAL